MVSKDSVSKMNLNTAYIILKINNYFIFQQDVPILVSNVYYITLKNNMFYITETKEFFDKKDASKRWEFNINQSNNQIKDFFHCKDNVKTINYFNKQLRYLCYRLYGI